MKALELNEMEEIEGGKICYGGLAGATGLLLGVATLAGPVGWGVVAGFAIGGLLSGAALGDCISKD
ncbi:MAG: hypothetical protein WC967_14410 [Balneolaceae bacterium]